MQNFIFSKLFLNSTTLLNLSQIWQNKLASSKMRKLKSLQAEKLTN